MSCHSIHAPSIHGQTHLLDSIHPCLNVDEILRLIACELVASRGEGAAVILAYCCKCFEDLVLATLWTTHQLDELLPLLTCFPGDVWNDRRCTVSAPMCSCFSLLNDLIRKTQKTPDDDGMDSMPGARSKDARVQLTWHSRPPEVFSVLQLCIINEPLLPSLKILRWWEIKRSFISFVPLFISQRITSISLTFESDLHKR